MIKDTTKTKLLSEIEKNGNVSLSCAKVGVDKSTFYRWMKNESFKKLADEALVRGREANCDMAESALMLLVKEKKFEAIKYVLSHNNPRYKPKVANHKFIYEKIVPEQSTEKSFESYLDFWESSNEEQAQILRNELTSSGKIIPPKPDGTPILDKELVAYEAYIRNWQRIERTKRRQETQEE